MRKYTLGLLLLMLVFVGPAHAADRLPPASAWSTVAAGGGQSAATGYQLYGVLGQAGPVGSATTTGYRLEAGFLPVPGGYRIFLPLVLRS